MLSRRALNRSLVSGLLVSLLPRGVKGVAASPSPPKTRVIYEEVEWGQVKEFLLKGRKCLTLDNRRGQYSGAKLVTGDKVKVRAFEVAAWPTWSKNLDSFALRAKGESRAREAMKLEVKLNVRVLKTEFQQRIGYPPSEIRVGVTDIKQLPADPKNPHRQGALFYQEVGMVAFG